MKFQKGHVKLGGRKVGSKNKFRVPKLIDFLSEVGVNPVKLLMDNLETITDPKDRHDAIMDIVGFCQGKPKEVVSTDQNNGDELDDLDGLTNEELKLRLVTSDDDEAV